MTEPPHLLNRPADAPPPLERASNLAPVQSFKREFSAQSEMRSGLREVPIRAKARAWAGRVSGRAQRRLLFAAVEAVDALVVHCDLLTDRLTYQESLAADIAAAYGEDLTRLRSQVLHLSRLAGDPEAGPGG